MKTANEITNELAQFTGTAHYYLYSPLFPNMLLTDGAHYLAEECGAYWLMDMIGSYLPQIEDWWAIAELTVTHGNKALFTLADDKPATKFFAHQAIEYTDFPLEEVKLYVILDGEHWVVLIPSEY